jgi:outer membrane receptor protein involved in Fe transport
MRGASLLSVVAVAAIAAPVEAREAQVSVQAGTLEEAAIALARQTRTSIVVADPGHARRKVKAIRGQMSAAEAVRRLARSANLSAVEVSPSAWRLVAAPQRSARARPARRIVRAAPPLPVPDVVGEPIVVVASKRDLRADELAGQVSILDGARLQAGGVGGTERITQRLATVSSTYLGSGRNKLFIRGIADSSFTGPTQATVGQYLGDLRLSYNAPDPDLRLSDLERVEVLEGPQGTLYGAGSLGGIIRLVPRTPEFGETTVSLMTGGTVTRHGEPGGDVHATANLPLVGESAALRFNFDAARLGGYIDKPRLGRRDVNRTHIVGGRGSLRVALAPDWTVDVIGLGQTTRADDSQYADRDGAPLDSDAVVQEGARADYAQGQFVISGRIGEVRVRSSTGAAWQELRERYDATAPGGDPRLFVQHNDTRMIANETRAWQPLGERFGWLAGVSFTDNRTRLTRSLGAPDAQATTTGVLNTVTELTAYGETSVRLFGPLIAGAGARITRARLGGAGEDVARAVALAGAAVTAERTDSAFLPSASLLAEVAPRARIYLRYQEGFRPGGLAIAGDFVRQFRSDNAATIELGAGVGDPGRGPFDLSASLSRTRWRHIQADYIDDTGLPTTSNIGDGTIWTASLSAGASLAPGLRVEAGATYNRSRVDEPIEVMLARVTQIPNIARFSGRAGVAWQRELGNGFVLDADSWVTYVGKSRLGVGPELGDPQGDYLDSGAVVRLGREHFGVTLSVTNIADVEGNRFALGTPIAIGREQVTPLQPRTVRVGFDARF